MLISCKTNMSAWLCWSVIRQMLPLVFADQLKSKCTYLEFFWPTMKQMHLLGFTHQPPAICSVLLINLSKKKRILNLLTQSVQWDILYSTKGLQGITIKFHFPDDKRSNKMPLTYSQTAFGRKFCSLLETKICLAGQGRTFLTVDVTQGWPYETFCRAGF